MLLFFGEIFCLPAMHFSAWLRDKNFIFMASHFTSYRTTPI